MSRKPSKETDRESVERRVEALASEIVEFINARPGDERNDLRDLALAVLREEVKSGEPSAESGLKQQERGGAFNPIAMAIPLFLIGAVMIVLFPPVGLLLFGMAGLMVVWGLVASLFSRRSKEAVSPDGNSSQSTRVGHGNT